MPSNFEGPTIEIVQRSGGQPVLPQIEDNDIPPIIDAESGSMIPMEESVSQRVVEKPHTHANS